MRRELLAIASIALILIAPLYPAASAAPAARDRGLHVEVTLTPRGYSVAVQINATVDHSASVDRLESHVSYRRGGGNETCSASLNASLALKSPSLEGVNLDSSLQGRSSLEAVKGYIEASTTSEGSASLHVERGAATLDLSFYHESSSNTTYNLSSLQGVEESQGVLDLSLTAVNNSQTVLTVKANLTGHRRTVTVGNSTASIVAVRGPVSLLLPVSGRSMKVSFTLDSMTSINATLLGDNMTHVKLHDESSMVFADPAVATGVYLLLSNLVTELNLTQYVKVELVASAPNYTVKVTINYEGDVNLTKLASEAGKGIGGLKLQAPTGQGLPSAVFGNLLRILTGGLSTLNPNITGTLNLSYKAAAHASGGSLEAKVSAEAQASGDFCNTTYGLTKLEAEVSYDNTTRRLTVNAAIAGRSAEPYTPAIGVSELIPSLVDKLGDKVEGALIVVKAADGVRLSAAGTTLKRVVFTKANYTALRDLAVEYGGVGMRMAGKALEVTSSKLAVGIKIPPIAATARSLVLKGPVEANITLPLHGRLQRSLKLEVYNSIASGAKLLLHKGARVAGVLHLKTLARGEYKLPPGIKAYKAGPALEVEGVSGVVTVVLPYKAENPGKPALLVIHNNGTVEVVTNVTVKDGYIIANVTASSVFAPITLAGAGGGGTTTTQTTTTTTHTTTSTSKTTITTSTTTTKTHTQTATTSTATSGTLSTTSTTTTSPTGTQTSTGTSSHPATTTTQGAARRTATIAAAVVVVVIIIAAAALLARRH